MASAVKIPDRLPRKATQSTNLVVAVVLLTPFVQLGFSYWISVQVLISVLVAFLAWRGGRWKITTTNFAVTILIVAGANLSLLAVEHVTFADVLRVQRELVVFSLLVLLIPAMRQAAALLDSEKIIRIIWAATIIISVFAVSQLFLIPANLFPTFPFHWFVSNSGTLPEAADLAYSAIRPSGPFGEPSYLAFITLSYFVGMHSVIFNKNNRLLLFAMIFVILISKSMSGYIFLFLIFVASSPSRMRTLTFLCVLISLLLLTTLYLAGLNIGILDRILNIAADQSTVERIFLPMQVIPSYISDYIFGAPIGHLGGIIDSYLGSSSVTPTEILHNGLFNLLFSFGFVGALIVLMITFTFRNRVILLYVLLSMFFNGAFLAPDKFAIIMMVVMIHYALSMNSNSSTVDCAKK